MNSPSTQDIVTEYELTNIIADNSPFPLYETTEQLDIDWLGTYLLHPINVRISRTEYPLQEVDGMFVISNNRSTLAMGECQVSGGRGQWCGSSSLWIFDLNTGNYEKYDLDLRRLDHLQFNHTDSQLTIEGCLEQPNAHFGWCGDSAIVGVSIADGRARANCDNSNTKIVT